MEKSCLICKSPTVFFSSMLVRKKHTGRLLRCTRCDFLFIEDPFWLAEAYADPINRSDVGYVYRNLWSRDKVSAIIEASELDCNGKYLDYAAGYGMFVRLMRDSGYDFRWDDPYCKNLFSLGFEAETPLTGPFEAVTAFEVLEHLPNPLEEVEKIIKLTSVFLFTTTLVPDPIPSVGQWWYYGQEHGQHIAFYSRKCLESLAQQFGYQLVTNGKELHALTRKTVILESPYVRQPPRWKFWARRRKTPARLQRRSLMESDYNSIVKQMSQ